MTDHRSSRNVPASEPDPAAAPAIEFPTDWEFRIILEHDRAAAAREACLALLLEHDPAAELTDGGASSGGKYLALRGKAVVFDRDDLNSLSDGLRRIDGVKMLI